MNRRTFLKGAAAVAASGLVSCRDASVSTRKKFTGRISGANWRAGHMLNEARGIPPTETFKTGIAIVGAGIAGLSAARELSKKKFGDFVILELEDIPGGNSASGSNRVSAYPFGAHYVPIPGEEAVHTRELFEELGIIKGYDSGGLPVYDDFYLCFDPMERLFIHGRWQEGLLPQIGTTEDDRRQYSEFFDAMEDFRQAKGSDGRRAFAIPIELSSKDEKFRSLDRISMERFLDDNRWSSEYLRWYVNYCCRDDYGSTMAETSAWAGIHYFASRNGRAANADSHAVVTWPEGNGRLVKMMLEKITGGIRLGACVLNIGRQGKYLAVDFLDTTKKTVSRMLARSVIYCAPRFTALKVMEGFRERPPEYAGSFTYAPWLVANVTVTNLPEAQGAPLSWDNVPYSGESLGYVAARHQELGRESGGNILTYYHPLTGGDPVSERTKALARSFEDWAGVVTKNLSLMHRGIEREITEIDVRLWGHAMIRPQPGFVWGQARAEALKSYSGVYFAHSDMSGISIFEEAQYRGITAAKAALAENFSAA